MKPRNRLESFVLVATALSTLLTACGAPPPGQPSRPPQIPVGVCEDNAGASETFQAPAFVDNFRLNDTPENALISKIAADIDKSPDAASVQDEWREFAAFADSHGLTAETLLAVLKFYGTSSEPDSQMDGLLKKSWENDNLQKALRNELVVIQTEKTKKKGKADAFASVDFERMFASPSADVATRLLQWKYCTEAKPKGIDYDAFVAQTMEIALKGSVKVSVDEALAQQKQILEDYFGKTAGKEDREKLLKSALNIGSGAFELPDEKIRSLMADAIYQRLMQKQPDVALKLWAAGPVLTENGLVYEKEEVLLAFCRLLTKKTVITRFPFALSSIIATGAGKKNEFSKLIDSQKVFFPGGIVTLKDLNERLTLIDSLAEEALIHPSGTDQSAEPRVSYGRTGSAKDVIKFMDEVYYLSNLDEGNSDKSRFQFLGFQWVRDEKQTSSRKYVPVALVRRLQDDKITNEMLAIYPTERGDLSLGWILNVLKIDFQKQGVWTKAGLEESRLLPFVSFPAGEFIYDPLYLIALK